MAEYSDMEIRDMLASLKTTINTLLGVINLQDEKINILFDRMDKLEQNTRKNWRF